MLVVDSPRFSYVKYLLVQVCTNKYFKLSLGHNWNTSPIQTILPKTVFFLKSSWAGILVFYIKYFVLLCCNSVPIVECTDIKQTEKWQNPIQRLVHSITSSAVNCNSSSVNTNQLTPKYLTKKSSGWSCSNLVASY